MEIQTINLGANPSDGSGDTLNSAFDKVNANFSEVMDVFTTVQGASAEAAAARAAAEAAAESAEAAALQASLNAGSAVAREMFSQQVSFFRNNALVLHLAGQPELAVVPADRPDDLALDTSSNRRDHKSAIESWWENVLVPRYVMKNIPIILDFSGVMLGCHGVRLMIPRGRGNVRVTGGGTGGLFYNKMQTLTSNQFSILKFQAWPEGHPNNVPGATHMENIWIDGMHFVDPASSVHAAGEQSHGPSVQQARNVSFTNNYVAGFGDEGWETGYCDGVWTDGNVLQDCVNREWGDGGAISIKQGDRNWYAGVNFVRRVQPLEGLTDSVVSAVNVKLVAPDADCHNIHLGTIIAEDCNVGLALNSSASSVYGLTMDRLVLRGTTRYAVHKSGGQNTGIFGFDLRYVSAESPCVRLLDLRSRLEDGHVGRARAVRCTDPTAANYFNLTPDLRIEHLEIADCPGAAVAYASAADPVHIEGGRFGFGPAGIGYGLSGSTALFNGVLPTSPHTLGKDVVIRATEHRGSRILANLASFDGTITADLARNDGTAAAFNDGIYRVARLGPNVMVKADLTVIPHRAVAFRVLGGTYERLSGSRPIFNLGAATGAVFTAVRGVNPAGSFLYAGSATKTSICQIDYSGCSLGLGNLGTDPRDAGGHVD